MSRHMLEVRDANRKNDAPGFNRLPVIQRDLESFRQNTEIHHKLVFKLRDHSVFKGHAVGREGIKADWNSRIAILDAPILAKLFQGKIAAWIIDIRREAIRLKQHAFGHM